MPSTLPLSVNTTRALIFSILPELHTLEVDARTLGFWDKHRDERITQLCAVLKARCAVKDADGKVTGYADDTDPFADVALVILRAATIEVWALKAQCAA